MDYYYVNTNSLNNGDHEVHKVGCIYFSKNSLPLGIFSTCFDAINAAKSHYSKSNGCAICCALCHATLVPSYRH